MSYLYSLSDIGRLNGSWKFPNPEPYVLDGLIVREQYKEDQEYQDLEDQLREFRNELSCYSLVNSYPGPKQVRALRVEIDDFNITSYFWEDWQESLRKMEENKNPLSATVSEVVSTVACDNKC